MTSEQPYHTDQNGREFYHKPPGPTPKVIEYLEEKFATLLRESQKHKDDRREVLAIICGLSCQNPNIRAEVESILKLAGDEGNTTVEHIPTQTTSTHSTMKLTTNAGKKTTYVY